MKEKKDIKKHFKKFQVILIIIVLLVVWFALLYVFSTILPKLGHPIFNFLSVLYCDSLSGVVIVLAIIMGILISLRKEGDASDIKRMLRGGLLIAAAWIVIINLFSVSKDYEAVLIQGKKPSRMAYKFHILQDAISGETKVETFPVDQVIPFINEYHVSSGRGHSGSDITTYYIVYESEEKGKFASLESWQVWKYVEWIKERSDTIKIEYYVHSGIIKTIDGIDKNDRKALFDGMAKIEEDLRLQAEREELQKQKLNEQETKRYQIIKQSVGKNIEDVRQELEVENIPFIHNVKYISSLRFACNTIAFWDNEDVYVVRDNLEEEMIPVPRVELGMSKEEIIAVLTGAGFTYECDTFQCSLHEKGTLHTIRFGGGELVPKGYKVRFSIDE